jgi:hypothetical protein
MDGLLEKSISYLYSSRPRPQFQLDLPFFYHKSSLAVETAAIAAKSVFQQAPFDLAQDKQ